MRTFLKLVGSVAGAALLMTSAGPAAARGWGGGWGPPRYRHYDRGSDAGAIIGAVAVVGIIAAIASSANKRDTADRRYDGSQSSTSGTIYNDRPYDEQGYDDSRSVGPGYAGPSTASGSAYDNSLATHASQDEAVDACVIAARNEGTSRAGYADVREIGSVRSRGNGWDVTGTISERQNYRAVGNLRSFTCAFEDGRVSNVALD
jgi:hypothetical protein